MFLHAKKKFELIRIKIGFFTVAPKFEKIPYTTCTFHEKWLGKISPFSLHFLIHIDVLQLRRNYELIHKKIRFFMNFQSCFKIRLSSCTI